MVLGGLRWPVPLQARGDTWASSCGHSVAVGLPGAGLEIYTPCRGPLQVAHYHGSNRGVLLVHVGPPVVG